MTHSHIRSYTRRYEYYLLEMKCTYVAIDQMCQCRETARALAAAEKRQCDRGSIRGGWIGRGLKFRRRVRRVIIVSRHPPRADW